MKLQYSLRLVLTIGSACLGFRIVFFPVNEHLQVSDLLVMESVGGETRSM